MKELVRYIHLNPLRAGMVKSLQGLKSYPYSGHSALMGEKTYDWQQTGYVLELFGKKVKRAREQYEQYVAQGLEQGRRPELVGGGLADPEPGGLGSGKEASFKRTGPGVKGDVRILGEGDCRLCGKKSRSDRYGKPTLKIQMVERQPAYE